jgi:hypothetical protein
MIYGLDCQADRLLDSSPDTEEKTEPILKTDPETASLTGWQRIYGLAPQTVINWIKNQLEDLSPDQVLIDSGPEDILALDERWSLADPKANQAWLGFAIGSRNQQLVGWHVGQRDQVSANYFVLEIPSQDRICRSRNAPWHCYQC